MELKADSYASLSGRSVVSTRVRQAATVSGHLKYYLTAVTMVTARQKCYR